MANCRLERVLTQLINKLIKKDRRTCLGEDTLDQLLRVNVEGPPFWIRMQVALSVSQPAGPLALLNSNCSCGH